MRNASAVAHVLAPRSARPHLVLVPSPTPRPPAPATTRLAALLSGLISGFLLSAFAAFAGGGSPRTALTLAVLLGLPLVATLARARAQAVRRRRRAAARRAFAVQLDARPAVVAADQHGAGHVVPLRAA